MERIGEDLARELGRFGPQAGMGDLVAAWPGAVGEAIARHAWPARISRDGTAHVSTSSSAWAFELGQLAPTLLERLRTQLGEAAPTALRFAVGRLPEPDAAPLAGEAATAVEPTAEDRELAAALAAEIDNEELRALVARAAAASLAKPRSDR